jgi:HAD superfamily hydrolase (TIGR01509 family)
VEQPTALDALSAHWRATLYAAEDMLQAVGACGRSVGFPTNELHDHRERLAEERKAIASLLEAVAHEQHLVIHHKLSTPRATWRALGLPPGIRACVFDLDGVLTASASIHAAAWAETFDELLWRRVEETGERFAPFRPFATATDYDAHIHGRPRREGIHEFLASRGISLPEGSPTDPPGAETVWGLANRKNEALQRHLARDDVEAFAGSRRYLEAAREAGLLCAVVSPSENSRRILERAGLASLIDRRVDGTTMRSEGLRSKPAPDTLRAVCRQLDLAPEHAADFETTLAGISAGRAAGFGLVIGVDRDGRAESLQERGADRVVGDLAALLAPPLSD